MMHEFSLPQMGADKMREHCLVHLCRPTTVNCITFVEQRLTTKTQSAAKEWQALPQALQRKGVQLANEKRW